MAELPCRRCGELTANTVIIYGPSLGGSLVAKQAQCRGVCPKNVQPRARQDRRGGTGPFTSIRPGVCAAGCGLDIQPGDRIMRAGDDHYHEACSPEETGEPQSRRRERTRTRLPG